MDADVDPTLEEYGRLEGLVQWSVDGPYDRYGRIRDLDARVGWDNNGHGDGYGFQRATATPYGLALVLLVAEAAPSALAIRNA